MKILAVETSCDDTCASVIEIRGKKMPRFKVLSNVVSSQIEIHKKWGGVYPALAKREHQRNLIPVLKKALKESNLLKKSKCQSPNAKSNPKSKIQKLEKILEREEYLFAKIKKFLFKYKKPKIDAIAVTVGPGLEPCLWTGINLAKALAFFWNLPFVSVNHIKGHIFVNVINREPLVKKDFPTIALVVSGGHTQLILMRRLGDYKILGETRDDAAGECFDKIARILGLPYPGGPEIARHASQFRGKNSFALPRPMINSPDFDFSFSGLKTAVLYQTIKDGKKSKTKKYINEMAAAAQQTIIDVLITKTLKATKKYKAKTIMLGGGVFANKELRRQMKNALKKESPDINCLIPDIKFCTDNAVMIAVAGYFRWQRNKKGENWRHIEANGNLVENGVNSIFI